MNIDKNTTADMRQSAHDNPDAGRHMLKNWLSMGYIWNIPIYQRHYSWDSDDDAGQVRLFWDTVVDHAESRLRGTPKLPHYFGAVLANEQRQRLPLGAPRTFDVVDGQQRLTTIQLALLALVRSTRKHGEMAKRIASELSPYLYLGNKPILQPTNYDNDQYESVLLTVDRHKADIIKIDGDDESFAKSKVIHTFEFFDDEYTKFIEKHTGDDDVHMVKVVDSLRDSILEGFDIVLIQLRKTDRPQAIFQSLNTTSKPLTTLDLIRNDVFQRAADVRHGYDIEVCNSHQWKTFEKPFWEEKIDARLGTTHIEAYIPRMLIAKLPGTVVKFERNSVLKTYGEKFVRTDDNDIVAEVSRMIEYADTYRDLDEREIQFELPTVESSGKVKSFGIFAFNTWRNRDFWPAVFIIVKSDISADEKQRILRLLESYVVRRHASGYSSGHYNQFVVDICAALGDEISYNSLWKLLQKSTSASAGFPTNDAIRADRPEHNFFGKGGAKQLSTYVLQVLARDMMADSSEVREFNKLTIDHILPQSWYNVPGWREQFLAEGEDIASEKAHAVNNRMHTIGNLTLLSATTNPKKSNLPFSETLHLLNNSALMLNKDIVSKYANKDSHGEKMWDLPAIEKRGADLVNIIRRIWPHPDNA